MILDDLSDKLTEIEENNAFLYFITRILKPEVKKRSKVMDKFSFKVYQVDINPDIRKHLFDLTKEQLEYLLKKKIDLHQYEVISDDTQNLFTYSMANSAMSFADVVNNQLKDIPPKIASLEEVMAEEELWAYSVGFKHIDGTELFTFRKILASKVAIDEKDGNSKALRSKVIRTLFNTKSQKLELIHGETVNLDKQIDCIFFEDTFYIAKKTQFEQIVCLEEEFKKEASEVCLRLESTQMILGIEYLAEQIEQNPSIHKKLVRVSRIGTYRNLTSEVIEKMAEVCKAHKDNLKVKDGKLLLEDEKDVDLALKMLCDYYKRGEVSGKAYGTFAGKELNE